MELVSKASCEVTWFKVPSLGVFLVAQMVKNLPANAGDMGSIHGSGRSPGEGNGNPFLHSCLENPMDGGVWWATVQESDMTEWLTHNTHTFLSSEMLAASVLRAESRKGAKDLTVYHAYAHLILIFSLVLSFLRLYLMCPSPGSFWFSLFREQSSAVQFVDGVLNV